MLQGGRGILQVDKIWGVKNKKTKKFVLVKEEGRPPPPPMSMLKGGPRKISPDGTKLCRVQTQR